MKTLFVTESLISGAVKLVLLAGVNVTAHRGHVGRFTNYSFEPAGVGTSFAAYPNAYCLDITFFPYRFDAQYVGELTRLLTKEVYQQLKGTPGDDGQAFAVRSVALSYETAQRIVGLVMPTDVWFFHEGDELHCEINDAGWQGETGVYTIGDGITLEVDSQEIDSCAVKISYAQLADTDFQRRLADYFGPSLYGTLQAMAADLGVNEGQMAKAAAYDVAALFEWLWNDPQRSRLRP